MLKIIIGFWIFLLGVLSFSNKKLRPSSFYKNPDSGIILLDFDGFKSNDPGWGPHDTIRSAYMSIDSKMDVQSRVEKFFNKWDVIVTTNESLFYKWDTHHRVRVVVTSDSIPFITEYGFFMYAGGVSKYNSLFFGDTSCAAVSASTLSWNNKKISEAIAHEVGHAIGLGHQSTFRGMEKIEEYNSGDSSVAPIMGRSYDSKEAKWIIGINNFGQEQNDTALISKTFRRIK